MGDRDVGVGDDMGEGMHCSDHPYPSNPGGICAFCLQEKLGKLVSSSKSNHFFPIPPALPQSSSSSSPSLRSEGGVTGGGGMKVSSSGAGRRIRMLFISASQQQKKKTGGRSSSGRKTLTSTTTVSSLYGASSNLHSRYHGSTSGVLKRSKSVAPRPAGGLGMPEAIDSSKKKSFWSFLSLTSSSSSSSTANKDRSSSSSGEGVEARYSGGRQQQHPPDTSRKQAAAVAREEGKTEANVGVGVGAAGEEVEESPCGSQASSSFGRKVARSRSVGCGSRSFSGDFLERISTGFADCTLRRVESQREAKPRVLHRRRHEDEEQGIKERVRCGGVFGGFGMISSSWYWLSADVDDDLDGGSRSRMGARGGSTPHGRSRSWGWAFASPIRALRPSSKPYAIAAVGNKDPVTTNAINSTVGVDDGSSGNKIINADGGRIVGEAPSLLVVTE